MPPDIVAIVCVISFLTALLLLAIICRVLEMHSQEICPSQVVVPPPGSVRLEDP